MPVSSTDVIVRSEDRLSSELEDQVAITDIVGSWSWRRIEPPARISDLPALLCEEHKVASDTCERDVLAFVEGLVGNDLARVEN